jgi:hypothetical protein
MTSQWYSLAMRNHHLTSKKQRWLDACMKKISLPSQVEFRQRQSYCRASFLIEITPSREYPFKPPEVIFLDPVYPSNVDKLGCHYCCYEHFLCKWGVQANNVAYDLWWSYSLYHWQYDRLWSFYASRVCWRISKWPLRILWESIQI